MDDQLLFKWFALKKWQVLPFQLTAWKSILKGNSGLISVPTGAGKTYAAYLPALARLEDKGKKGIKILYITPLKALANDLESALKAPIEDLNLSFKVARRTGDVSYSKKKKQMTSPPDVLLITPESLSLLLADLKARENFQNLQTIIIDEWHELMSSKRGCLTELAVSRLKSFAPDVQIWGLSATIGNLEQAALSCVGLDKIPDLINTEMKREVIIQSITPNTLQALPWVGFLGIRSLPLVLEKLDPTVSTIIFVNTRAQAEKWYLAILESRPDWQNILRVHHGSIDKKERDEVEEGMKIGNLKIVVCTSSLDLGIDFPHVKRVLQIGSPKSISRMIQRAGRASHQPLTPCDIFIVPTHALELLELKAYRKAVEDHEIEKRYLIKNAYDVLLQHLTTCAIGGGFYKEEMYKTIQTCSGFSQLTKEKFEKCLSFLVTGGSALAVYPEYKKMVIFQDKYVVEDSLISRRHKMNIGTITSDALVVVKFLRGKSIGLIEESFLNQLKNGDQFLFAGKILKLMQYKDLTAYVSLAKKNQCKTVTWRGGRLPFSEPLGKLLRKVIVYFKSSLSLEDTLINNILQVQNQHSYVPKEEELLIEIFRSREGFHLFVYPFEGKTLHEGLANLTAHRLSQNQSVTFVISCNDYGFEILSRTPFDEDLLTNTLFSSDGLEREYKEIINLHELAKGCFRDIARISGLIFTGYPHKHKSQRQLQLSSGLLYEVLEKYDPGNLLIEQAKAEVLEKQFDHNRLAEVLERLSKSTICCKHLIKLSPFSLPLYMERVSERLTTETTETRLKKILEGWKKR